MTHEAEYHAENPKPATDANGELFEWFKGLIAAICADINMSPAKQRKLQVRVVRTGEFGHA